MTQLDESNLSDEARKNIEHWLRDEKHGFYKEELEILIRNEEWEILEDSFFRVLPFGTGGRRGTCGIGSNRINRITIGETQQALCEYLKEIYPDKELKIAIAYDSRLTSKEFASYCAQVASGNGVTVYLFDGPRSTPELSYVVRELQLDAGVVITASHNPSSDNGIKLYWSDGGQLVPPHDKNILNIANSVNRINDSDKDPATDPLVTFIGDQIDNHYWSAALKNALFDKNRDIKIAYSPLHGTGITSVYPALQKAGFEVILLEEQASMDGRFPNVTNHIPNPEVPAANDKLATFALQENCDIATSNDPDADRFCILVAHRGEMVQLTGNQAVTLMTDYVLGSLSKKGALTDKCFISSTIVTTDMLLALAEHYGVKAHSNLLVGFKYIGEQINLLHDSGREVFVCGGEESYGGIIGDYCRDKDAAGPTLALSEFAAVLKSEGRTLIDKLDELYANYGVYLEDLHSITFPGAEGFLQMQHFMDSLRSKPPKKIAGELVVKIKDYNLGKEIPGRAENVIRLELSNDGRNRVTVRPSGTEPKLKIYTQVFVPVDGDLQQAKNQATARILSYKDGIESFIGL